MRIAIIGAGGVTRGMHIPSLELLPGVEIAGVASASPGSKIAGLPFTTRYEELLARPDVDAVINATPNYLHREITLAALAAGKHVLCEKPLGLNFAETVEMLASAEKSGRVHMTGYSFRYMPSVQYARALVEAGALGEIRSVRAAYLMAMAGHLSGWRSERKLAGSGALADIGSHVIHVCQFLLGPLATVTATGRGFHADVDDWIGFLAQFQSGVMGTFEISRVAPGRGAAITENMFVEIYGRKGGLALSMQDPWAVTLCAGETAQDPAANLTRTEVPAEFLKLKGSPRDPRAHDPRWGYRYDQSFQFVEAVRHGEAREPSFRAGAECQAVLDAVLASCESGQWAPVEGVSAA